MARRIATIDEMIDILSSVDGGVFINIGYMSAARIGKTLRGKHIDVDRFCQDIEDFKTGGGDTGIYDKLKAFQQGGTGNKNKFPYGGVVKLLP